MYLCSQQSCLEKLFVQWQIHKAKKLFVNINTSKSFALEVVVVLDKYLLHKYIRMYVSIRKENIQLRYVRDYLKTSQNMV